MEGNPALTYLAGKSVTVAGSGRRWNNGLIDTYQLLHPSEKKQVSLHLWDGNVGRGWKVDHILAGKGAKVMESAVVMDAMPFSSDHFPVTARVVCPEKLP